MSQLVSKDLSQAAQAQQAYAQQLMTNNFIMEDDNDDYIEQVRPEQLIVRPLQEDLDLKIEICKNIIARIPANELRAARRPQNMTPRTFFLDRPFRLLPQCLNEPCLEAVEEGRCPKIRLQGIDCGSLTMEQYLRDSKFKKVYNKLQTYRPDSQYFTGKLKGLDAMTDYNWRLFKELEEPNYNANSCDRIDSDFEGGNMCRAYLDTVAKQLDDYSLLIENDINTYGYNIWFFFRFRNLLPGIRRFNILNIIKDTAFYNQGMKISIFSIGEHERSRRRWFKGGSNITFQKTTFVRNHHQSQYYYSLSFDYNFQHPNDQVYFALSQPYTYSRLVSTLQQLAKETIDIKMQIKTACYSISNNILPLLRFSKRNQPEKQEVILIIGRQHPCETVGSFIAEGIIRELVKGGHICRLLMDRFEVQMIPMMNPDGVIHGMSRTNMAGLDLNRQWSQHILKELSPQTSKIQQLISQLSKKRTIKYVIDLHGHGKKLNSFFFSCKTNDPQKDNYRLFSYAMKKLQPRFNLSSCTYGISKDKQTTLRSKMNSLGIRHSYTVETSQFGWKNDNNQIVHYNESDYQSIAKNILNSIFVLEGDTPLTQHYFGLTKGNLLSELELIQDLLQRQEKNNDTKDNLSDSDPEGDRLDVKDLIAKCDNKLIKRKIQENFTSNQTLKFTSKKKSNQGGSFMKNVTRQLHHRDSLANTVSKQTHSKFSLLRGDTLTHELPREDLRQQQKIFRPKFKTNMMITRQKNKKLVLPIKINAPIQSSALDPINFYQPYKQSKMNTEPVERQRVYLSSSLGSASEYSEYSRGKLPCSHPPKTEKHDPFERSDGFVQNVELKFKELKKQSLNYILTETISIMKMGLQKSSKQRQNHSSLRHNTNEEDYTVKRRCHTINQKQISQEEEKPKRIQKFRQFKQFMVKNGNNFPNRTTKPSTSVYYHFPIL